MKNSATVAFLSLILFCVPAASADTFGSGANSFDVEFVAVGNPGNPADTTGRPSPAGSVPYRYRIGIFEISEQMIDKANVLGKLGISKDNRGPNKPATNITWNEAARFVNWLNTSTGSMPAYKFARQPSSIGYDANADIQLWGPADRGYDPNNLYRNSLARYFLPSVHEWYKAAYYDPTSGVYYKYPTGSDIIPTPVASGTTPGTAVFNQLSAAASPADIMIAGGLSPYGTMAQGGNVFEWEETAFDLVNGPSPYFDSRGVRGGHFSGVYNYLHAVRRAGDAPFNNHDNTGFRVASVIPEPGTLFLVALGGISLSFSRRARTAQLLLAVAECNFALCGRVCGVLMPSRKWP